MSVLVFDVGNGSVKYARFSSGEIAESGRAPPDDLVALPPAAPGEPVAAVSVNPAVLARLRERYAALRAAGEDFPLPLPVPYGSCGADRVVGVYAALEREPQAAAVLVVDAGTCVTVTVGVRGRGVLGGAILPGPHLMARALAEWTAALPAVEPAPPRRATGESTEEAIRSGIRAAVAGGVRELIRRCATECPVPPRVLAGGTAAALLSRDVPEIEVADAHLTLRGVHLAARDILRA